MQKFRIFVASPSDMATERSRIETIASALKPLADNLGYILDIVDWSSVVPDMGRPEQVILDQVKPSSWDVFIGILWHRFGTPTGGKDESTKQGYLSGTEEEFKTAYHLWQTYGFPRIMMYRCTRNIPQTALDLDQYNKVQDFFRQFDAQQGIHPGLYQTFDTIKSFEKLLFDNLQRLIIEHGKDLQSKQSKNNIETKSAKVFICYQRSTKEDRALAEYLKEYLETNGHDVFIDISMRIGTDWLNEIDQRIKLSDYLIVLVSKNSAESEMVQAEIKRAYEYRQQHGRPHTLPVRMNYEGLLPYTISAFVGHFQQISWLTPRDNERIAIEISRVMIGDAQNIHTLHQKEFKAMSFTEDGRAIYTNKESLHPLPEFDPRILDELEEPGGSLKLNDKFYIKRDADEKLKRNIVKTGSTITVRASRQTGKSSLLVRGLQHIHDSANIIYLDLQSIEHTEYESSNQFLKYLAVTMARKLKMHNVVVNQIWQDRLGPQDKLVKVLEEYILPKTDRQIILAMDEADRLLGVPFQSDFFAMMRSWHNTRAMDPLWNKLNLVMVIATEPYLLISNPNQSPFNVGVNLDLEDFNHDQVQDLNYRHGNPIKGKDIGIFFELFNGHPYLTRKALYMLVGEHWDWNTLLELSTNDQGPFADHLRRQLWIIREDKDLQASLRQVIRLNRCDDDKILWRLMRAGLVKGSGDYYRCRCGLYEEYFKDKLK